MNDRFWKWLTIAALSALAFTLLNADLSRAQALRGYQSRPCGFDNDLDGNPGEAGECDYCDGNQSTGTFTADPDQDGQPEDIYWVDCNSGSNTGTGTNEPDTAYRTIAYAISQLDGPNSGQEDIICVRSTCRSWGGNASGVTQITLNTTTSGKAGVTARTAKASENEVVNFEYPDHPFRLIGWDTDQDGSYPPHDTDQPEPFIIDLCASDPGSGKCPDSTDNQLFDASTSDRVEFAHFTIRNVAAGRPNETVFVSRWATSTSDDITHHFWHDIRVEKNLQEMPLSQSAADAYRVFSFNAPGGAGELHWLAFENLDFSQNSSWPMRGAAGQKDDWGTHLRVKNISDSNRDVSSPETSQMLPIKPWMWEGLEFLNNKISGTGVATSSGSHKAGLFLSRGNFDVYAINNEFIDTTYGVKLSHVDSDAFGGGADNLNYLRNIMRSTGNTTASATMFIVGSEFTDGVEPGECPSSDKACNGSGTGGNYDPSCSQTFTPYLTNVTIDGNVMDNRNNTNLRAFVTYQNGSNCDDRGDANTGPIEIRNNRIIDFNPSSGSTGGSPRAVFLIGRSPESAWDWDFKWVRGSAEVENNLVTGIGSGDFAIINQKRGESNIGPIAETSYYDESHWLSRNNVFEGPGTVNFGRGRCSVSGDCETGGVCTSGLCVYNSLAEWQAAITDDANSDTCSPAFDSDEIHLTAADSCARNQGVDAGCGTIDIDQQSRPVSTCDIGADEVQAATQAGSVQFSSGTYAVSEIQTLTASIPRTGGSDGAAAVNYATASGTAIGGALCTEDVDFIHASGTKNWGAGVTTTQTFDVTICNDSHVEGPETFTVNLSGASGASLGSPSSATVTITSDDVATETPVTNGQYIAGCPTGDGTTVTILNVEGNPSGTTDRMAIVGVAATADYNAAVPSDPNCDMSLAGASVVRGGTETFTRVVSRVDNNGLTYSECVALFAYANPSPAPANIVVTFPGTVHRRNAAATILSGVEQVIPTGTWPSADGTIGSPATRSLSVTTTAPVSGIVDVLGLANRVNAGNAQEGAGQVELAEIACGTTGSHMMMSLKPVDNPTTTSMSWSWTTGTPERYAHVAAVFVAAQPPPITTSTTTTTLPPAGCGNGVVEAGEQCDGADLDGKKCSSFWPFAQGTLACHADCSFNYAGCSRTKRGRRASGTALGWCESAAAPACNGTCPGVLNCVSDGGSCECQ